jgi:hypothetical protein
MELKVPPERHPQASAKAREVGMGNRNRDLGIVNLDPSSTLHRQLPLIHHIIRMRRYVFR